MVKEIGNDERDGYITGALNISTEKIEGTIDAFRRGNYGQVLSSLYYAYFHLLPLSMTKWMPPDTYRHFLK